MTVAIDGPAGVGKSTITEHISKKTGLLYVNSGNFYRAVTFFILKKGLSLTDEQEIINTAEKLDFKLTNGHLFVEGLDLDAELHTDIIDSHVAAVSSIIGVRNVVNHALHTTTKDLDIIVEGRDITTVVFPHADIKIYLDASVDTRARRRWSQGVSNLSFEEIKRAIEKRDDIDKNKKEGSLKISSDALYLDTSDLTIDQVCEKVIEIIKNCNKSIQEK